MRDGRSGGWGSGDCCNAMGEGQSWNIGQPRSERYHRRRCGVVQIPLLVGSWALAVRGSQVCEYGISRVPVVRNRERWWTRSLYLDYGVGQTE
jgi:hypothetical protein